MGEVVSALPEHTYDQSKSNINQLEDYLTSSRSLNNKFETPGTHDIIRTQQSDYNDHGQESNKHNTKGCRPIAQDIDNEDMLSNCPAGSSQPHGTVLAADHKEAEHIAHVLQAIGDRLDASATDYLSEEIVEALRSIGDRIDAKIGDHGQNFVKMALGLPRINVGHMLFEVLRPRSFVGTLLCTSLQLLLHYNSI